MTAYIILNSLVVLFIIGFCAYVLNWKFNLQKRIKQTTISTHQNSRGDDLNWKMIALIITAFGLVIAALCSPFIFTREAINKDFDFSTTGQIGDTIGGLSNPFISLAGVIVTGLAFYIQFKANQQQRELFEESQKENTKSLQTQIESQKEQLELQKFHSQFYEMVRLHRDNVSEMQVEGYNYREGDRYERFSMNTDGRKLFTTMVTEFECILSIYQLNKKIDSNSFKKCYKLFFFGLDRFAITNPEEIDLITLCYAARKIHEDPDLELINKNSQRKIFKETVKLYFNYKPFSGHSSRLAHYYRHLYLTVKMIASSSVISRYGDKMNYIRILRAQLSNQEQVLLLYNWLGGIGDDWENNQNQFFTEFCLIHNLPFDTLLNSEFIRERVNYLRMKTVKDRPGRMFELDNFS